ncbi:ead/Ea22-like family protein [Escherichia coli]|uniref:ead/Ea22-like family protein n=1 Tax=Escherichia coli TaxID=562 RepID=UPI000944FAD9|nr:ead/Ea22-like family protein [Escherichia coli]AUL86207.1 eae-like domain protein [Escherichia coli]AUL89126.1 eae-like domain protein [Escherichia coli]AUM23529.1 eae-like domain protein [Escherichia coli]EEC7627829.1 ead/Ea22-like family protein [Escherichia coli]EED0793107.1 ead/Ea22-like family protein [Escherichia coli]
MSNIDTLALREAAEQAMHDDWGFDADLFHELVTPSIVLALLDEREAANKRITELEASRAALAAENAGLKAFKTAVYQQMGVGCDAPEFSITTGLSNLRRFADTLHAIEREFFTKELPDEEHEGETFNECPLSWGMSVEQYVSEFRKCLAEVRAQGVEMYADNLDNGADDAERGGFDDAVKFLRSEASGVRLFADQLRKGGNQ